MTDYFETALSSGFSAAILDPSGIESMGEYEFCQKAESLGIDLRDFKKIPPCSEMVFLRFSTL